MPDFNQFERIIREAMVSPASEIANFANRISNLDNSKRPKLFKKRTQADLEKWLSRAHTRLRTILGKDAEFKTSDVNIRGADLSIRDTNQSIELKTGQVTDANAGISTIAWAMGDTGDSELRAIMNDSMYQRRKLIRASDFEGVRNSQNNTMKRLERYFRERLTEGETVPFILQHYSRSVAYGITKKNESVRLLSKPETEWNIPRILHARWNSGWIEVSRPFALEEDIFVSKIFRGFLASNKQELPVPRAQVQVKGTLSNRTALYYPNYKNSHKDSYGNRMEAKYWVQTACFHVWIDK